jgi:hypothetical protein
MQKVTTNKSAIQAHHGRLAGAAIGAASQRYATKIANRVRPPSNQMRICLDSGHRPAPPIMPVVEPRAGILVLGSGSAATSGLAGSAVSASTSDWEHDGVLLAAKFTGERAAATAFWGKASSAVSFTGCSDFCMSAWAPLESCNSASRLPPERCASSITPCLFVPDRMSTPTLTFSPCPRAVYAGPERRTCGRSRHVGRSMLGAAVGLRHQVLVCSLDHRPFAGVAIDSRVDETLPVGIILLREVRTIVEAGITRFLAEHDVPQVGLGSDDAVIILLRRSNSCRSFARLFLLSPLRVVRYCRRIESSLPLVW